MQISVEPATPEVLRGTRLQTTWDGTAKASVDVPMGHFFGHAYSGHGKWFTSKAAVLGKKPLPSSPYVDYTSDYNSLLPGVTSKEAYSRFPMPFASGATLTIQNRSGTRIENLRVRLDVERFAQLPTNWGRFHATWTESPAATDKSPVTGPKNVPVKVVLQKEGIPSGPARRIGTPSRRSPPLRIERPLRHRRLVDTAQRFTTLRKRLQEV